MPPHLVPLVWWGMKTFPHVGHILHLISIRTLLIVTTSVMCWTSCVMLEQRTYLPPNARSELIGGARCQPRSSELPQSRAGVSDARR